MERLASLKMNINNLLILATLSAVNSGVKARALEIAKGQPRVSCFDSTLGELEARIKQKNIKNLVFFASWCLSCKKHILEADIETTLFVVAFDKVDSAVSALNSLILPEKRKNVLCELDRTEKITKFYRVKSLPYRLSLEKNSFRLMP